MVERQELYCHNCGKYVQFNLDLSIDDNYVLDCPNCGHKHYRVVREGRISDERWGQDPSQKSIQGWSTITTVTYTTSSNYSSSTALDSFLTQSWASSNAIG